MHGQCVSQRHPVVRVGKEGEANLLESWNIQKGELFEVLPHVSSSLHRIERGAYSLQHPDAEDRPNHGLYQPLVYFKLCYYNS